MSIALFIIKILFFTFVCSFFVRQKEKSLIFWHFLNGTTKFVETTTKNTFLVDGPILIFCNRNRMKNASKILSNLANFRRNNGKKLDECILGTEIRMLCRNEHNDERWEQCPAPEYCEICDFWRMPRAQYSNDTKYNLRILLQNLHKNYSKKDGFDIGAVVMDNDDQYSKMQILPFLKPKMPIFAFNYEYEITLHQKIVNNLNCGRRGKNCRIECLREKMSEICGLQRDVSVSNDKFTQLTIFQCLQREFSEEGNALYTKFCSACKQKCKQVFYHSIVNGKLKFPAKNLEKNVANFTNNFTKNFLMIKINFDDRLTVFTEIFVVNFLDAAVALGYVCFGLVICYFVLIADL